MKRILFFWRGYGFDKEDNGKKLVVVIILLFFFIIGRNVNFLEDIFFYYSFVFSLLKGLEIKVFVLFRGYLKLRSLFFLVNDSCLVVNYRVGL